MANQNSTRNWLADRVTEALSPHDGRSPEHIARLRSAPKIAIDDAAEFYFSGTDKETWDIRSDFPFLIPPFDCVWLEFSRPSGIVSNEHGSIEWGHRPTAMAVSFTRMDARTDGTNDIAPEFAAKYPRLPEGTRHILIADVWLEFGFSQRVNAAAVAYTLDEAGGPTLHEQLGDDSYPRFSSIPPAAWSAMEASGMSQAEWVAMVEGAALNPSLLGLSFMNCRNTEIVEAATDRAFRKREERKGRAVSRYYVLTIKALKKVVSDHVEATGDSARRALHICRGHFATYSDDHPLFGKYTGRYWRPAHVRGAAESGVVVKDYSMGAAK